MFCKNCGYQLSDDALFCNNCGARQNQDGPEQAGSYSPPVSQPSNQPGAYYPPPGQYAVPAAPYTGGNPPPKNNTTKIIIISLACLCVVIAAVLIIVLLKPFSSSGNNVIEANLPSSLQDGSGNGGTEDIILPDDNDGEIEDIDELFGDPEDAGDLEDTELPDNTEPIETDPSPSGTGNPLSVSPDVQTGAMDALVMFDAPVWSAEPIYKTIDLGGVWTSVGIASNPDQISGEDGVFYLSDFDGCMYYFEFFEDLTWNIKYIEDDSGIESRLYEIMDIEYCVTFMDDDGVGYRFYNGNDGRLYMCYYADMGDGTYPDLSDFVVFERKGDSIDWAAEASTY